jgi:hypothetical protein
MYKYLGGGFITGIPARDLTDDEARPYKKNPGFQKLYKKVYEKKEKSMKKNDENKGD